MALPPAFLDELRARTPLPAVIGRRVKLARAGRQWKGCCPFHGEKTPSFYVYDDHYHCFGCGEHGDAISFVMRSQGVSFTEAVEQLAAEAGLEVPKPSPAVAAAERRRLDLYAVLEAATQAFQRRLFLPEGARALAYLRNRGLTDATIRGFGLGWAGEGRGALAAELAREGIEPAQLIEAGLMKPAESGRPAADMFFNRVMFPIRDRRGRTISFGGRILGDGQPKYVNGPETAVFAKRRTLFGLDLAREAAHGGASVVAVEGYMDVIALHQAGFGGAVAPLGTALTEEQLAELWRLSPVPVLCFDGDAAGARAAGRAAELALPHLTAERSLKLATLPPPEDPDTLVRRPDGVAAFQAVLDAARPLSEALFDLLRESLGDATPEQRAAFSRRLEEVADQIPDRALGWEYRAAFRARFRERYRGGRPGGRPGARGDGARSVGGRPGRIGGGDSRPAVTAPPPAPPGADAIAAEQARILVAILLRHPVLLQEVEERFGSLVLPESLARLRSAMLEWFVGSEHLDSAELMTHLTAVGLAAEAAQALSALPIPLPECASPRAMPAEAEAGWWHIFGLMHRSRLDEEVALAQRDFAVRMDAATQRRLISLRAAQEALNRGEQGLETDR
ncbi:DNA primase [Rhodovastum atsumiense]|uniref:DNA primase n=1 Tax=Rhodovastum atsumiense TaxID=504468 RepID=A0A5M6IPY7_9PROT|nr:DNA primase [Rhodovastum atsumiense]KAA5609545.1 DNA primase [Rhodovastum atsumiense]CAH2604926.1 DNA primase [Rhodovastum atsumiense]